jgi:homoserine O-acetyltransferase
MKKLNLPNTLRIFAVFIYPICTSWTWAEGEQQYAQLDECHLESGENILECQIGYRTFGRLDADGSNAVLFPTSFTTVTQDLIKRNLIGPESFIDSSRFFVIAVDAFGNGVSSSPSNSGIHEPGNFPAVSIADMVNSQYRLLTEKLGINHLAAVVGISMGGMQTFEWAVSYPSFMDKAVSIVGSPKLTSYDLLLWSTQLAVIEALINQPGGDLSARRINSGVSMLNLQTPSYIVETTPSDQFETLMATSEQSSELMPSRDRALQLNAMIHHDISAKFDGSWERVRDTVEARFLIAVNTEDHIVNPAPALEFARALGARTLKLETPCGHMVLSCERDKLQQAVTEFLAE